MVNFVCVIFLPLLFFSAFKSWLCFVRDIVEACELFGIGFNSTELNSWRIILIPFGFFPQLYFVIQRGIIHDWLAHVVRSRNYSLLNFSFDLILLHSSVNASGSVYRLTNAVWLFHQYNKHAKNSSRNSGNSVSVPYTIYCNTTTYFFIVISCVPYRHLFVRLLYTIFSLADFIDTR